MERPSGGVGYVTRFEVTRSYLERHDVHQADGRDVLEYWKSEAYVWLYTPREMLEIHEAWADAIAAHPGIAIIGGDGSREHLALDLRQDPAPVLLVDITCGGWDGAHPQAATVADLIGQIEAGTFRFEFGDD